MATAGAEPTTPSFAGQPAYLGYRLFAASSAIISCAPGAKDLETIGLGLQLTNKGTVLRDRGGHFIGTFDETFRSEGIRIFKKSARRSAANAVAAFDAHR